MIIGQHEYKHPPNMLGQFMREFHHEEEMPRKDDGVWDTIKRQEDLTIFNLWKRIYQGVKISLIVGVAGWSIKVGPKKIFTNREHLNPLLFFKRFRYHFTYGIVAGIGWYILHDQILCGHGKATYTRHLVSYAIGGAVVTMTAIHPSMGFFGAVGGTVVGFLIDGGQKKYGPVNFEVNIPNIDPETKEKARRDDVEKQMSRLLNLSATENKNTYVI